MKKLLHKAKNLSWTILDQGMVSGVNFAVGILIARFLGVKEFGIFSIAYSNTICAIYSKGTNNNTNDVSRAKDRRKGKKSLLSSSDNTTASFSFISNFTIFRYDFERSFFPQWEIIDYAFYVSLTLFLSQNQDFFRRVFCKWESHRCILMI